MFIFSFISVLVQMLIYVIFIHAVMSFLFAFGVINMNQPFAARLWQSLSSILEPFYRPIRRFLPQSGAIDFAPMVLLLILFLFQAVLPGV